MSEWFRLPDTLMNFLIKPFDSDLILKIRDRFVSGDMGEEEALFELFKYCLIGWRGIADPDPKKRISKTKKLYALFGCIPVRDFVLRKGFGLLEAETFEAEKLLLAYRKWVMATKKEGLANA